MWQPAPEHSGDILRLRYYLERARRNVSHFQLLICAYADSAYRDRLLAYLDDLGESTARVDLSTESTALPTQRIVAAAQGQKCLHVVGIDFLLRTDAQRWLGSLNLQRETLARRCNNTLLLWWPSSALVQLSLEAPDFWAWRSTEFDFHALPLPERPAVVPFDTDHSVRNSRELADKQRRRSSIEDYLQRVADTEEEDARLTASLTLELAEISFDLGELERSYSEAQRALELYHSVDNRLGVAQAQFNIANIFKVRGDLDAALAMLTDKALPVFAKLGDVRSIAITKSKIADILELRGDLDAALHIREQEELSAFKKLGDLRSLAITQGQIADILQTRGDLDAALRIREQEELPVYTELGDVRSVAVTQGKIADIMQARGEFDAALRIREQEELPVFIRLGDVREAAVAQGKIADIMQLRGDLNAALRMFEDEVLPAFIKLGGVHETAVTQDRIADILRLRGDLDAALDIYEQKELPVYLQLGDVRSVAVTQGKIADIFQLRGDLDSALRVREQEVLPVFTRLGDKRSKLLAQTNIALILLKRRADGDIARAHALLDEALIAARTMRIPEAERIAAIMRQHNLEPSTPGSAGVSPAV